MWRVSDEDNSTEEGGGWAAEVGGGHDCVDTRGGSRVPQDQGQCRGWPTGGDACVTGSHGGKRSTLLLVISQPEPQKFTGRY